MVWTSGGGGGSSKKSSSSSSSSSDKKTNNVTIRSQKDADEYEGKTLTGTTTIYPDNGLELKDIRFKGDVDIKVQSDAVVASAYADSDVAVAAAYAAKINIYFEGKTSVSGTITVVENNVPSSQVVIRTRTPRALSASVVAKVATAILGFAIDRVEATAPVEVAEGASVGTVELGDDASLEVADTAESVDKVNVTGDAKDIVLNGEGSTDVAVRNGASVENVEVNDNVEASVALNGNATVDNVKVSDSASADVAVKDSASVGKVELSDTATAKVDVAEDAKVDTITSTSTAKGSEVTGEGTVNKIEATDDSTIDTSNSGDNIPDVTPIEPETPVTPPTTDDPSGETVAVTGVTLDKTTAEVAAGSTVKLTATVAPENATNKNVTWASSDETKATIAADGTVTGVAEGTATITVTTEDGSKTATCAVTVTPAGTETVDKAALTAAITAATEAKDAVVVSGIGDGSDVLPTKQWVTQEVMTAFETAISDAQDVAGSDTATQDDVDAAVTALGELHDNATVSASGDGKDVAVGTKWVTTEQKTTFKTAISDAQDVADNASATDDQINEQVTALTNAQKAFEDAMAAQDGKKVTAIGVTGLPVAADVKEGATLDDLIADLDVKTGDTGYGVTGAWKNTDGSAVTDFAEGDTINLVLTFAPAQDYALDTAITTVDGVTGATKDDAASTGGNLVFKVEYTVAAAGSTTTEVTSIGVTGMPATADVKEGATLATLIADLDVKTGDTGYTVTGAWEASGSSNTGTVASPKENDKYNLVLTFAPADAQHTLKSNISAVDGATGATKDDAASTDGNLVFKVEYTVAAQ